MGKNFTLKTGPSPSIMKYSKIQNGCIFPKRKKSSRFALNTSDEFLLKSIQLHASRVICKSLYSVFIQLLHSTFTVSKFWGGLYWTHVSIPETKKTKHAAGCGWASSSSHHANWAFYAGQTSVFGFVTTSSLNSQVGHWLWGCTFSKW